MENDTVRLVTSLILKHKPDIIYISDWEESRFLYCSQVEKILGYESRDFYKDGGISLWFSLIHQDDHEIVLNSYLHNLARVTPDSVGKEDGIFTTVFRLKHKNGNWKWFEAWDSVIGFEDTGKPKYIFGMGFDRSSVKKDLAHLIQKSHSTKNLQNGIFAAEYIGKDNAVKEESPDKYIEKEIRYLIKQGYATEHISSALHIDLAIVEKQREELLASRGVPDSGNFINALVGINE